MNESWFDGWCWGIAQAAVVGLLGMFSLALAYRATATVRVWMALAALAVMFVLPWASASGLSQFEGWTWAEWLGRGGATSPLSTEDVKLDRELAAAAASPWFDWVDRWLVRPELMQQGIESAPASSPPLAADVVSAEPPRTGWWIPGLHGNGWTDWRWITWGFIALSVWGMLRLLMGLLLLRGLVARAHRVVDAGLQDELARWQARLQIERPIELLVSDQLDSAAVVGWWRPRLVLPASHASWTPRQREAVLAHELAHIASRDGVVAGLGQLLLALNYFQPMAHLVLRRLRFDQELAADATAARLLGSRAEYLEQLALLALERPPIRSHGLAHAFLPSRHMFLRRLEMLQTMHLRSDHWSKVTGVIAMVALVVSVGLALGLRPLIAQESGQGVSPIKPEAPAAIDLAAYHIGDLANAVIDVDAAQLMSASELAKAREQMPLDQELIKGTGILVRDLERVVLWMRIDERNGVPALLGLRVKSSLPQGIDDFSDRQWKVTQRLDDRTVVFALDRAVLMLARQNASQGTVHRLLQPLQATSPNGAIRAAIDVDVMRMMIQQNEPAAVMLTAVAPLYQDVSVWNAAVELGEAWTIKLDAETDAPARVAETLQATKVLLQNFLKTAVREMARLNDPEAVQVAMLPATLVSPLLETMQVSTGQDSVAMTVKVERAGQVVGEVLAPALIRARAAAQRAQKMNNLKQIALALHVYHDVYKRFPPAVVKGPKGHPHSWRVMILPYLEQNALFQQYRMDEPCDSPHNLQLAKTIPAVYAGSPDAAARGETNIHAADLLIDADPARGVGLSELTDGTSNTLLVVQQAHSVPWTAPRDERLPEDLASAVMSDGVVLVAMADGAARAISATIAPELIKALRTPAGGEQITDF
jgi:beta-lactamase regulating signal transducer with metallopeptidase domain